VALLRRPPSWRKPIPPCINLIILGFVANLSIGGLFVAGLLPAGLMALALIVVSIMFGKRLATTGEIEPQVAMSGLWSGAIASFGLIFMIFAVLQERVRYRHGNFGVRRMYAIVVGRLVFGELGFKTAAHSFVQAATRSGLVLFIVAAAQSLALSSPCSKCRIRWAR